MKFIIPIVVCIIVGATLFIVFDIKRKADEKSFSVEYIEDEEKNIENNEIENTEIEDEEQLNNNIIQNTAMENITSNNIVQNNVTTERTSTQNAEQTTTSIYETDSDAGTTDKKQQAINLVKEKWGEDDTVTYRCDSVTSSGEYIIAVISKNSAVVKNYFKVNLETKSVVVDY